ncbi:alpha-ketoglutarate-dependent dioxygenase AlkB [Photobacterium sp. MCCC 1A19761]|uniref:alpha-ketoglutarate-dependent dioxygenase AlkB family protein n=1 Tax=Photobacterium sp. MCCC 1A19761 TaxID=3115000 RepID=UPI00307DD8A8
METLSLFPPEASGEWLDIPDGRLYWAPAFFSAAQAQTYFEQLRETLDWRQEQIRIFGRNVWQPRLQAWCGEASYTYSGLTLHPAPWTPALLSIKTACEAVCDQRFNSVLANLYRDGQDSMGWHQDNEPELGPQPVIASVSLGETRRFVLKHLHSKQKITFDLTSGSLLIMAGTTQQYWTHAIPKSRQPLSARMNLTYRTIYPAAGAGV